MRAATGFQTQRPLAALVLAGVGWSCQAQIGDGSPSPNGDQAPGSGSGGAAGARSPGTGGNAAGAGNPAASDGASAFRCDPAATTTTPTPLRRLSVVQYENTLRDLFAAIPSFDPLKVAGGALGGLPPDDVGSGFRGMDARLSERHLQAFYDVADVLAGAVTSDDARLGALATTCARQATITPACIDAFLDGFAVRVYRRPLTTDERTRYQAINNGARDGREVFRSLLFSLLMAPPFLYHVEVSGSPIGASETNLRLGPYELASRLSYHFWQTMPDAELFRAAKDGSILTDAGFAAQAKRVFADARTRKILATFYAEWFQLGFISEFRRNAPFQSFTAGTGLQDPAAASEFLKGAADEIAAMAAHYTWNVTGTFRDLLLTDLSFARSPTLARLYGVPPWDGVGPQPRLPRTERAGLLTRTSFLLSGTHSTHPIHRGAVVRRRVLCDTLVAPDPSSLPPDSLTPPPPDPTQTTRQRFANKVASEPCASCHALMNPIGYVLERFDALGRHRQTEDIFDESTGKKLATLPVDSTAVPRIISGDTKAISSGAELSQQVADSGRAEACFARQYFRFSYHREETDEDSCALEGIRAALAKGNLSEALYAVAMSPGFRLRRAP